MNIPERPAISVITCLYNTPPNLFEECLKGLVNQTFTDFEVLIVNDGSDKYLEENKALIEKLNDARFKYFDTEHTGKSQTLNYALKIAEGKYIAINDSDDVSYPKRLEYQYNFLTTYKEYDLISNAMKADPSGIIFPGRFDSCEVTENDLHYKANHPSQMFNRRKVLETVPFLFEQIYDSMEDNVFNHIMFYYGIKMWYDSTVLVKYSCLNPDAVHYENLYGYKKEGSFKLFYRTFNADKYHEAAKFTCILLINKNWNEEIEKTLLNIRFTADCVKIILVTYDGAVINKNNELNKYGVKIYDAKNLADAINVGVDRCETEYLMIIGKPIRFYNHNWDLYAIRNFELYNDDPRKSLYRFVQPYMTGIDKIDKNQYYNNNGKVKDYKLRKGNYLILLDNVMTEACDELKGYSEYIDIIQIPIIDEDLVFITSKYEINQCIQGAHGWDDNILLNVFLSLKEYSKHWGSIHVDTNIKCGVIDNFDFNDYDENEYKTKYLINMWKIICFFFNETKFIYEKIIHDIVEKIDNTKNSMGFNLLGNKIIEYCIDNDEFNTVKNNFTVDRNICYFLKHINLKYRIWDLTYKIY